MKLRAALELCQVGQYVCGGSWTEQGIQYFYDEYGTLHWTAGGTTGGLVMDNPALQLQMNEGELDLYEVYDKWEGKPVTAFRVRIQVLKEMTITVDNTCFGDDGQPTYAALKRYVRPAEQITNCEVLHE